MKPLLLLLALLVGCAPADAPETRSAQIDTAAVRQQARACADAWVAEHGHLPETLHDFAGLGDPCKQQLFNRLDATTRYALWMAQLDHYARTDSFDALQRATLENLRRSLSVAYFSRPQPGPNQEELLRLFGTDRAHAIFFSLGSMYEPKP